MVNSRKTGDIINSNFSDNANFQSDNVTQTQTKISQNTKLQIALEELDQQIKSISDHEIKEKASMYFDMLLKYIQENKQSKIERSLKSIKDIVGVTASILTIASQFGIAL